LAASRSRRASTAFLWWVRTRRHESRCSTTAPTRLHSVTANGRDSCLRSPSREF